MLEHTCIHMTMQAQASDLKKDFLSLNLQLKGNSAYLQVGFIAFPFRVGEVIVFGGVFSPVCLFAGWQDISTKNHRTEKTNWEEEAMILCVTARCLRWSLWALYASIRHPPHTNLLPTAYQSESTEGHDSFCLSSMPSKWCSVVQLYTLVLKFA